VDSERSEFVDRVDNAIKNSPHISQRELTIRVEKDRVVLSGTVESYYQKQIAQETVRRVDGVQSIDNRLEVAWSKDPRKSQPALR